MQRPHFLTFVCAQPTQCPWQLARKSKCASSVHIGNIHGLSTWEKQHLKNTKSLWRSHNWHFTSNFSIAITAFLSIIIYQLLALLITSRHGGAYCSIQFNHWLLFGDRKLREGWLEEHQNTPLVYTQRLPAWFIPDQVSLQPWTLYPSLLIR